MASISVELARAVTTVINETTFDWPAAIVPTTPDRLDTVVTAQTALVPVQQRSKIQANWSISVNPSPLGKLLVQEQDVHCARSWVYPINVGIMRRMDTIGADVDWHPNEVAEVELSMELAENILRLLDTQRQPPLPAFAGRVASLTTLQHSPLYDRDELQDHQVFFAQVDALYRFG